MPKQKIKCVIICIIWKENLKILVIILTRSIVKIFFNIMVQAGAEHGYGALLHHLSVFGQIQEDMKLTSDNVDKLEGWFAGYEKNKDEEAWVTKYPFMKFMHNIFGSVKINWLSLRAIYTAVKQILEQGEERAKEIARSRGGAIRI